MAVWSGLGMNYNSSTAIVDAVDLPYIYNKGIHKIRVLIVQHDSAAAKTAWRATALAAKAIGFYVIYGCTEVGEINAADWSTYSDNVIAEATYCQANNVCDEFQIGNELELRTSDMSGETLRNNIRTLATAVQAVYSGVVSYSASRSEEGSVGFRQDATLGDLDKLGHNIYANTWDDLANFDLWTDQLITAFPGKTYISEWNLFSDSASIPTDADVRSRAIAARLNICVSNNLDAYFYNYTNSSGTLGVKNSDGSYQTYWNNLTTNNKRRWFINV